jgi:exosortase family protein XrtF
LFHPKTKFIKNKTAILFIVKFFVCYLILTGIYQYYLISSQGKELKKPDYITVQVSNQSVIIGKTLGYNFKTEPNIDEPSMKFFLNEKYIARIVEGCNSISVIILFWAFIVAFSGRWAETLTFGLIGSFLIYFINLFRIILLTYSVYHKPEYTQFLHKIIFPGIIYGFTFLLWVIWVKRVEKIHLNSK